MDEDDAHERAEKIQPFKRRRTKGFIKLTSYLEAVLRKDKVQERIEGIRALPEGSAERQSEVEALCNDWGLHDTSLQEIVSEYVNTGHYDRDENMIAYSYDLAYLEDTKDRMTTDDEYFDNKLFNTTLDKEYPIAIRISANASIQDIVNFVNKNSKIIKLFQKPYKDPGIEIGKHRSRSAGSQKVADFIYAHRDLSIEEIRKKLSAQKIHLDPGHIGKIRSLEKKRRK